MKFINLLATESYDSKLFSRKAGRGLFSMKSVADILLDYINEVYITVHISLGGGICC